ncbi:hypothetical protein BC832DRAFT_594277 [Gaertneriomyces semiglobifer]|nr:hypothetical protein BC832DRAFT_594277 [Gaertneriomyces semiglobifer]
MPAVRQTSSLQRATSPHWNYATSKTTSTSHLHGRQDSSSVKILSPGGEHMYRAWQWPQQPFEIPVKISGPFTNQSANPWNLYIYKSRGGKSIIVHRTKWNQTIQLKSASVAFLPTPNTSDYHPEMDVANYHLALFPPRNSTESNDPSRNLTQSGRLAVIGGFFALDAGKVSACCPPDPSMLKFPEGQNGSYPEPPGGEIHSNFPNSPGGGGSWMGEEGSSPFTPVAWALAALVLGALLIYALKDVLKRERQYRRDLEALQQFEMAARQAEDDCHVEALPEYVPAYQPNDEQGGGRLPRYESCNQGTTAEGGNGASHQGNATRNDNETGSNAGEANHRNSRTEQEADLHIPAWQLAPGSTAGLEPAPYTTSNSSHAGHADSTGVGSGSSGGVGDSPGAGGGSGGRD